MMASTDNGQAHSIVASHTFSPLAQSFARSHTFTHSAKRSITENRFVDGSFRRMEMAAFSEASAAHIANYGTMA